MYGGMWGMRGMHTLLRPPVAPGSCMEGCGGCGFCSDPLRLQGVVSRDAGYVGDVDFAQIP